MNHSNERRRWARAGRAASILSAASLLATGATAAPNPAPESTDGLEAPAEAPTVSAALDEGPARLPWLGLVLDAGIPDGANLGLVGRPLRWLRLHAGASYNLASFGVRGGVSYVPFDYWVTPTLVVEGGHFFAGSMRSAIETVAGIDVEYAPERVVYSYANLHLGLEFGGDWYTIFLRGGYSFVHASVRPPDTDDGVSFEQDVIIDAWLPSAKLGLIVYVY